MGKKRDCRVVLKSFQYVPERKKGQIAVFIVIAIAVIGGIGLIMVLKKEASIRTSGSPETNPEVFITSCLEDRVRESVNLILEHGGSINPEEGVHFEFQFSDKEEPVNVSYLCYTKNYYIKCINQKPVLIGHIKNEIKSYLSTPSDSVDECINQLVLSLKKEGYSVEADYNGFEIEMAEGKVYVNINAEVNIEKTNFSATKKGFKVAFPTRLYDIAKVAQEISSQEARYCYFENLGYMLTYPDFKIKKIVAKDSNRIYVVEYKDTKEKMRFAIRSCAIPAGGGL